MCDQISDAILDALLQQDPRSRGAIETLAKTGMILVAGEIRSAATIEIEQIIRNTIANIGYTHSAHGFDAATCAVINAIGQQSRDVALGVDENYDTKKLLGAGDQGLMFGFATNETEQYMPAPIFYAHALMAQQANIRKSNPMLLPDAKSQLSFRYDDAGKPVAIDAIVLSTQHVESATLAQITELVREEIIKPVIPANFLHADTKYYINPTGRFVIGGPMGDCGLTGRKIIVDTYGGYARHGGGAFSGKDPSKVDRSAAYAARYVAKNIVAAQAASACEIQVSYAIGIAQPTSLSIDTFATGVVSDARLTEIVENIFDLSPAGIIDMLALREQLYQPTAAYGHFGRQPTHQSFSWERTDKIAAIQSQL